MTQILVILDGAADPPGDGPTTLEAAHTPALDALAAAGTVALRETTPPGLTPGSETGIPVLLGAPPAAPVARGLVEAAAHGVAVRDRAWRIDLHDAAGRRASALDARLVARVLAARLPGHEVTALRGHRLLACGARRPIVSRVGGLHATVWDDGAPLPRVLDARTVVVCGPGAAAGVGRLLGARVLVPAGATGDVDTDLEAKVAVAGALLGEAERVVVHAGGPDEAAHRCDPAGKRAAIEALDARLVAPLAALGTAITVTADHTTCPRTGRHGAEPVPVVTAGPGVPRRGPDRFAERLVVLA